VDYKIQPEASTFTSVFPRSGFDFQPDGVTGRTFSSVSTSEGVVALTSVLRSNLLNEAKFGTTAPIPDHGIAPVVQVSTFRTCRSISQAASRASPLPGQGATPALPFRRADPR